MDSVHFSKGAWLKGVSSSYIFMVYYNNSLSLDAATMAFKNCPIIGDHVVTIFVAQKVTVAIALPAKNTQNLISKRRGNFRRTVTSSESSDEFTCTLETVNPMGTSEKDP